MATQTAVMEQGVIGRAAMDRIRDRLYSRLRAGTGCTRACEPKRACRFKAYSLLISHPRKGSWPDGSRSSERSRAAI
jgi:hypothetical protein